MTDNMGQSIYIYVGHSNGSRGGGDGSAEGVPGGSSCWCGVYMTTYVFCVVTPP
jgi:hypothetical protein